MALQQVKANVIISDRTKPIVRQALIPVDEFGGSPEVIQVYNFQVIPSMPSTVARCAMSLRGRNMSQPIKNHNSRRYLSRLITCVYIAVRDRSCVLRMRRKAITLPRVMVASIRLNMMTVLAMLSIPRAGCKRCCNWPELRVKQGRKRAGRA